ncbi:MAG: isoprenylcysteine carboxylmethyltransferase family protein [Gemmatimonadota bacterium]|nr:isoprenylcysteine carboxylmethyltransferase family protein [Gemmatimonadota bacterium]
MTDEIPLTSAGVYVPPPLWFAAGLLLGWAGDRYLVALPMSPAIASHVWSVGPLFIVAGVVLVAWGMVTFRRAGTAIVPNRPAARIVSSGPYRFTRNPMYTGLTLVYVGVSALLASWWPLLLLPVVLVVVFQFVIRREEAYLHSAFGDEYAAYCGRVGRWL